MNHLIISGLRNTVNVWLEEELEKGTKLTSSGRKAYCNFMTSKYGEFFFEDNLAKIFLEDIVKEEIKKINKK